MPQAMFPRADGTRLDAQELSEFLGTVRLSLEEFEEVPPTFFELSSGQVRG
ncbi:hypothetical protein GCM10022631_24580 [Deinococcus rubellus]